MVRNVLVNIEVNRRCRLTNICGDACILNVFEEALGNVPELSEQDVLSATREALAAPNVRHVALVGKEPLESLDAVCRILREYRECGSCPDSVGFITAGYRLVEPSVRSRLAEYPASWFAVSIDTEHPGLHVVRRNREMLSAALALKRLGGAEGIVVNSTLTTDNADDLLALGRMLVDEGIDQWAVSPLLEPSQSVMQSSVSLPVLHRFVRQLVADMPACDMQCVIVLPFSIMSVLMGGIEPTVGAWRTERRVRGTDIQIVAINPHPGHFVRLRWDGQLLSNENFRHVSCRIGDYGLYQPGRMQAVLESFARTGG